MPTVSCDLGGTAVVIGGAIMHALVAAARATPSIAVKGVLAAGARLPAEKSRGGHWRRDVPVASPGWARRLVQRVDEADRRIVCRALPLPRDPSVVSPSLASGM